MAAAVFQGSPSVVQTPPPTPQKPDAQKYAKPGPDGHGSEWRCHDGQLARGLISILDHAQCVRTLGKETPVDSPYCLDYDRYSIG